MKGFEKQKSPSLLKRIRQNWQSNKNIQQNNKYIKPSLTKQYLDHPQHNTRTQTIILKHTML